ncbi:ROK family protein [Glaciibacter flavus]|uniref:ROK family protein n=1 Tax=Orlajensenia flava TaxID=2565934 RepID=A0A4S4FY84_9MICO|nr:ROK family protein [Glaciibacter flavus]THG35803.1 ROK family protein [Glaciibacter flavus]
MRIGIDIGGTKTAAVAMDTDGRLSEQVRQPTGFGDADVIATAVDVAQQVTALSGRSLADVSSIGIGIPGAVDSVTGRVSHAVNLGVHDLRLGAAISERLGVSVRVENDVKAAAMGAHHLLAETGMANGFESMAYLNLGTGLAAGIVLGGRLLRGGHGVAGEVGHIPIDPNGALCSCGQVGCVETIASGSAIARMWPTDAALPAVDLFEAAGAGDPIAIDVQSRFFEGVAAAVRILVLAADVDVVVIGGGLSALGTPLLDGVCASLTAGARVSPFLSSLDIAGRVRVLPLGFPAAAVGAALTGVDNG